jgi:hypothetical protein
MLDPVVRAIVLNHYDHEESIKDGHPVFWFSTGTPHGLERLDTDAFAEWLRDDYGRLLGRLTPVEVVDEIIQVLPLLPRTRLTVGVVVDEVIKALPPRLRTLITPSSSRGPR